MESQERSPKAKEAHVGDGITVAELPNPRPGEGPKKERLLDFLRAAPSKGAVLARVASVRTRAAYSNFLRSPGFARAVDWRGVRDRGVAWARHPMNAALLVWFSFVAAGMAFVFLLMVGALDSDVPDASRRRRWTEVANQMLNALFTIMCVYQHPRLCHHLALLLRWRAPADVAELRAVYCKNCAGGIRRERLHVAVVVLLLHATCFAQYAYCALFWLFPNDRRPSWAINLLMALGFGTPIVAGLYMVYGPLGQKIALPDSGDEESATVKESAVARYDRTGSRRVVVSKPEWAGGLFDLADDPTVAAVSLSCTFCVFGWNMERLGLGNMYLHAFTFALLCAAPLLVFAVAALSIGDATLGYLVGAAGALLSVLGLTYGGFWRARMRKRFGLPADDRFCTPVCGGGRTTAAAAADYVKWLFCAPCALAQEVRTGNFYDVEDDGLYVKGEGGEEEERRLAMVPLEREGSLAALMEAEKTGERLHAPPVPMRVETRDKGSTSICTSV
ncbi:putative pentatricopeptide repeat-containing protein [Hordeum vulgare]|uniref:Uncharacterized protein n=1 Tax=Hordeum vulgare subsp. vulgare TaxID=112509 RepID=A0A8I6YB23_HORVV|nr:uncharacterized protein LOC123396666 [Hordeum vulgare subsp. vulgare]KAE8809907.1 putative pentatricopeptide repeat-containing protein [Hordeum vulgare]